MTAKGLAHLGAVCLVFINLGQPYAATVGDLIISEIMVNPAAVSDTRGEWFELFNPTSDAINLRGVDLGDDGGDRHRIETDLLILPGRFLTLGRNGDSAVNGGYLADYVYADFTLSNGSDEVVLSRGANELLRLDYGSGCASAGRSRELQSLPLRAANYALTLAGLTYGLGDIGSPGAAGSTDYSVASVPLPGAVWLFASGLLALGLRRRRVHSVTTSRAQLAAAVPGGQLT